MIFLRRYKKYIITPNYRNTTCFATTFIKINQTTQQANIKLVIILDGDVSIYMPQSGDYKYFLNQQPVNELSLSTMRYGEYIKYRFRVSVKQSGEWRCIYIFDKIPEVGNLRSLIMDHYKKIICISEWHNS